MAVNEEEQPSQNPTPCKEFSRQTDDRVFKTLGQCDRHTTTVYLLRPPHSLSSDRPWIFSTADDIVLRHPLTSKPHPLNHLHFAKLKLHPTTLAVSHHLAAVDTVVAVPILLSTFQLTTLFALYDGGLLRARRPISGAWLKLSHGGIDRFDDVTIYKGKVFVLDREGKMYAINNYAKLGKIRIGETLINTPVTPGSGRFGWRKRVVVDRRDILYVVVRTAGPLHDLFQLYKQISRENRVYWDEVREFDGDQVLFVTRDCHFFLQVSTKFLGSESEYKNCIVFTEGAFPEYGNGCWEFTPFPKDLSFDCSSGENNVAVFRLSDQRFIKEGENGAFSKIDWSPPAWIHDALSDSDTEFQFHSSSSSSSSDLLHNSASPETMDEEMHLNANAEGDASLQEDVSPALFEPESGTTDTQTLSRSATKEDITRTFLRLNGANHAAEEDGARKSSKDSVLTVTAITSSATTIPGNDATTGSTRFEGFEINPNLVSTLQKIWHKYGNIIENSIIRNTDIIAKALESLAIVVRILEDNTAESLSDSQADYIVSTLSDLRHIRFKVDWLIPFVEKANKLHESKPLVKSLNNLTQLSSQAMERRAILLDELNKLEVEENKRKEEMEKVYKMLPLGGEVKFDEPLGLGLT